MENPAPSFHKVRAHVFVSGKVQGVGYRYSTVEKASELGVSGWVRNLGNGSVEAVFEGTSEIVEEIIGWCYEGSSAAIVSKVDVEFEKPENLTGFEFRR